MTIIDDSYSASPDALEHALGVLRDCDGPRRAVLGELPQLGPERASVHREIGAHAAPWLDDLVAVGSGGRDIAAAAVAHGMDPGRVRWAADAADAASLLEDFSGGTLLVTGSHALTLERAYAGLLLDPGDPAVLDRTNRPPPTRRPVPSAT
jgi:UDP-N-acetylmuramoyl-tripeptide--D-alanyl-D-alanine ligase